MIPVPSYFVQTEFVEKEQFLELFFHISGIAKQNYMITHLRDQFEFLIRGHENLFHLGIQKLVMTDISCKVVQISH